MLILVLEHQNKNKQSDKRKGIFMSVIDQLISIKKSSSNQDIISMIDEFITHEKLSRASSLGTIKDSPVLQKRLPMMYKAMSGDMYTTSLYILASNILTHLNVDIPEALKEYLNTLTPKKRQQLQIAQEHTLSIQYESLQAYNHLLDADHIVAIYTNEIVDSDRKSIVIVVHRERQYTIYQGTYAEGSSSEETEDYVKLEPYTFNGSDYQLIINSYSLQGNNSYFFAKLVYKHTTYHIMMPDTHQIILSKQGILGENEDLRDLTFWDLSNSEVNAITFNQNKIDTFAETLSNIINVRKGTL